MLRSTNRVDQPNSTCFSVRSVMGLSTGKSIFMHELGTYWVSGVIFTSDSEAEVPRHTHPIPSQVCTQPVFHPSLCEPRCGESVCGVCVGGIQYLCVGTVN